MRTYECLLLPPGGELITYLLVSQTLPPVFLMLLSFVLVLSLCCSNVRLRHKVPEKIGVIINSKGGNGLFDSGPESSGI